MHRVKRKAEEAVFFWKSRATRRRTTIFKREMHQRAFLGGSGWARGGGVAGSGVVRRAHPASGAQWNVQVVKGKVNGKCLWNACKALSLGLLLMVLGAAMATIGYYADHLSIAQEVRGNHTVRVKNESRGFHLNNLSYAGPIVMGVGGFIVVAACVMTFEARDSAAKVVPARFKMSTAAVAAATSSVLPSASTLTPRHHGSYGGSGGGVGLPPTMTATSAGAAHYTSVHHHGSLRHSGSQTGGVGGGQFSTDRRVLTQSFMQFSRGLALESAAAAATAQSRSNSGTLKITQGSICKSPSAPDFSALERTTPEKSSPTTSSYRLIVQQQDHHRKSSVSPKAVRRTFAACALLNPGLLHRHALSVDETAATYRLSHESLHGGGGGGGSGSQGSMALDLHLECPITLKIHDRRRNPLKRQRRVVDEEERITTATATISQEESSSRRSSHSYSPRLQFNLREELTIGNISGGSAYQLATQSTSLVGGGHCCQQQNYSVGGSGGGVGGGVDRRRSSNASDCTHRSRTRRKDCQHNNRGRLERAISSDSRLTGAIPKCHHHHHYHHHHHHHHHHGTGTQSYQHSPTNMSTEDQEDGETALSDSDVGQRRNGAVGLFHQSH
ncbi:hypothetical protein QE152_g30499 [Popillia japonica]|uniref:Lateral signaling target protein 2 homolog n=1 Tax=Popillia japonica TaxID=7064 RepID=A0AAW1JEP0_POPJA